MYLGAGIDPEDCRRAGGVPRVFYARYDQFGRPDESTAYWSCDFPPSGAGRTGTEINVAVPTTATVSPQVSPQFIQQQQPKESPIGAEIVGPKENESELVQALLELQRAQAAQQPSNIYIPPAPATPTPDSFMPSGEKDMEAGLIAGIPVPYLLAAGILGAALIVNRMRKRKS